MKRVCNLKNHFYFFYKLLLLFFIIILNSCSGNYKKSADPYFLDNVAKLKGKFSVYLSDDKLFNKPVIESQDCESWQIEIEIDTAYKESLKNLIFRMFDDIQFTNKELTEDDLASSNIIAQIVFKNHRANSKFKVIENTANYNFTIHTELNVNSHLRSINNSVSSNKSWDKNLYLNCTANKGAYKSIQGSLENLMIEIHEKIYTSVKSITR